MSSVISPTWQLSTFIYILFRSIGEITSILYVRIYIYTPYVLDPSTYGGICLHSSRAYGIQQDGRYSSSLSVAWLWRYTYMHSAVHVHTAVVGVPASQCRTEPSFSFVIPPFRPLDRCIDPQTKLYSSTIFCFFWATCSGSIPQQYVYMYSSTQQQYAEKFGNDLGVLTKSIYIQ